MAYKAEKFPKPKNVIGMAKDIPVPEMEKLMLTHTEVKDEDLRTLASQRAMKVKDVILKSGQVEPERVFILEPKSLAPEKKEKVKEPCRLQTEVTESHPISRGRSSTSKEFKEFSKRGNIPVPSSIRNLIISTHFFNKYLARTTGIVLPDRILRALSFSRCQEM